MSPEEVSEIVSSRLSKHDMTPDGGCAAGFKTSLEKFLDKFVKTFRETHETFVLDQNTAWKEKSATLDKIVQNISGVTSQQLKVLIFLCFSASSHLLHSLFCFYFLES